ncbi:MAG TPA: hypothetical protein VIC85_07930 [Ktedonobacterales bacterium]
MAKALAEALGDTSPATTPSVEGRSARYLAKGRLPAAHPLARHGPRWLAVPVPFRATSGWLATCPPLLK